MVQIIGSKEALMVQICEHRIWIINSSVAGNKQRSNLSQTHEHCRRLVYPVHTSRIRV